MLLLMVFYYSYSQGPVIDAAWFPQPEAQYLLQPAVSQGVFAGPGGADMHWDFSGILDSANAQVTNYILPEDSPYADSFPLANLASMESDGTYNFLHTGNNEVHYFGSIDPNFNLFLSDPAQRFSFPISFGSSFTDSLFGILDFSGLHLDYTGEVLFHADAYGSLDLPDGRSFQNVLRYQYSEITEASENGEWVFQSTRQSIVWLSPDCSEPLLSINSFSQLSGTGQFGSRSVSYSKGVFTSVHHPDTSLPLDFDIFPNPSGGKFQIQVKSLAGRTHKIRLIDLHGKEWDQGYFSGTEWVWTPRTGANGIYIIEISVWEQTEKRMVAIIK